MPSGRPQDHAILQANEVRMTRILPHLVGSFSSYRREDLATEALAYVLRSSDAARSALDGLLVPMGRTPTLVRFKTQSVDEASSSRPDLVGYGPEGEVALLLEAKFDAGLTDNQPHAYLRQTNHIVLVVAPQRRAETLWRVLAERAARLATVGDVQKTGRARWAPVDGYATLALTSWRALIDPIMAAVSAHDPKMSSDVEQFAALCDVFESEAFAPFRSEELTSELGRRFLELADIIDEVTGRVVTAGDIGKEGLRATAGRGWWGQYLNFASYASCLFVDSARWGRQGPTPVWLSIRSAWGRTHDLGRVETALRSLWGTPNEPVLADGQYEVPVRIPIGVDRASVLDHVEGQLRHIADLLRAVPGSVDRA
jgi:hypothetical protein